MTSKIPTAKELLAMVMDGASLSVPVGIPQSATDDSLCELTLQCVEQILSRRYEWMNSADGVLGYVFQQFYQGEDGGLFTPQPQTPFDNPAELNTLAPAERTMVEVLRRVARLTPFLSGKRPFDLAMVGIGCPEFQFPDENCFSIRNEQLSLFIQSTPYRHLAARVAQCMLETKTLQAAAGGFEVMQDFLSHKERGMKNRDWLDNGHVSPDEVVAMTILLLSQADRYERTASSRYGMDAEQRKIYDMLAGDICEPIDETVVEMARHLQRLTEQPAASGQEYYDRVMNAAVQLAEQHDYFLPEMSMRYLDTYMNHLAYERYGNNS